MQITLNGQVINTEQTSVEDLLIEQGYEDCVVATALDGQFVATAERKETALFEGCSIDIVAPMQGG